MNIRDIILPREKTKNLRWFDVVIITLILFGKFIVISTQMYLATLKPAVEAAATAVTEAATEVAETTTDVATEGAAYSSNLRYQATMLAIVFIYLFIRNFDFKQVKFKLNWKIIPQYLVLFIIMGLSADILYMIFDHGYNYFTAESLSHIDLTSVIPKFTALSGVAIIYSLLNAFYEEFYFLGLLGTVNQKYKWPVLVFSTIIRTSFHTYQGMASALIIGIFFGLLYYVAYRKFIKNLLPVVLVHSMADMFGSGLIYILQRW